MIDDLLDALQSPNGRSGRRTFWLSVVILVVGTLIYELIPGLILGPESVPGGTTTARGVTYLVPIVPFGEPTGLIRALFGYGSAGGIILSVPLWLVQVLFALSIAVRRLHDCNKDWQWAILFMLAPFLLSVLLSAMNTLPPMHGIPAISVGLLADTLALWGYVQFGVLPGTKGMNRFGGPPGSRETAAEVFD